MRKHTRQTRKIANYAVHGLKAIVPDSFFRRKRERTLRQLNDPLPPDMERRIGYYLKKEAPFEVGPDAKAIGEIRLDGSAAYYFDLRDAVRSFPPACRVSYLFGDITHVPDHPTLVKSRPIEGNNENSVLMRFNQSRHFYFVKRDMPFAGKKDALVWRGKGFKKPARLNFIEQFLGHPLCDVGNTDKRSKDKRGYKPFMPVSEQLRFKFILSIEGNDVATNLKWILSSNSLCFMPRPRFETWFMEGTLEPGLHYVLVRDDYGDLEEKIEYYSGHESEALDIIENAHRFVAPFRNARREHLLKLLVVQRYLERSGQL